MASHLLKRICGPVVVLTLCGCTDDGNSPNVNQFCQTLICGGRQALTQVVDGSAPNLGEGGAYYWSALMQRGELVRAGTPRFVAAGVFDPIYLEIEFEEGEIPDGQYELFTFASATYAEAAGGAYLGRAQQVGPEYVTMAGGVADEICIVPIETVQIGAPQTFYAYQDQNDASYVQVFNTPQTGKVAVSVNWYLNDDLIDPWRPARAVFTVGGSTDPADATPYCVISARHVATPGQLFLETVAPLSGRCQRVWEIWIEGYEHLTLRYRAFIACPILPVPANPPPPIPNPTVIGDFDYGEGDARVFTSDPTSDLVTARISAEVSFNLDPIAPSASVTTSFGESAGFHESQTTANLSGYCQSLCPRKLLPGEADNPVCPYQAPTVGVNGNKLDVTSNYEFPTEWTIVLSLSGTPACIYFADWLPGITVDVVVRVRQLDLASPAQYRIEGEHDKFPWHEVYLDEMQLADMPWDPCEQQTNIWYLWPPVPNHVIEDGDEWNDI